MVLIQTIGTVLDGFPQPIKSVEAVLEYIRCAIENTTDDDNLNILLIFKKER